MSDHDYGAYVPLLVRDGPEDIIRSCSWRCKKLLRKENTWSLINFGVMLLKQVSGMLKIYEKSKEICTLIVAINDVG